MEQQVDKLTARVIGCGCVLLAFVLVFCQYRLTQEVLDKPAEQVGLYLGLLVGFANLTGVVVGSLVYAMTLHSGGNVDDMKKAATELTHTETDEVDE